MKNLDHLESQMFCDREHFARARKDVLSCRNLVQKGRRRLVTQRFEIHQLKSQLEILEDCLVSAFNQELTQIEAHFKLLDLLDQVKAMREEIKLREDAYNI